jgi:uncharacterized membrane protein YebE (DUF533 family)
VGIADSSSPETSNTETLRSCGMSPLRYAVATTNSEDSMLGGLMGGGSDTVAASAATHMDEFEAMILIKVMCDAAKADGRVDADEVDAIVSRAGDLDAEDEVMLRAELNAPLDMAGFVAEVPAEMAAEVYAASLLPIEIDTASEVTYLKDLGRALGLTGAQTSAIHEELGLR